MSGCPPDLALERYHFGEIAGTASAAWIPHIEGCEKCQAALAELARDDAVVRKPARRHRWAAPVAIAASVVAILMLRPGRDDLTPKGGGILALSPPDLAPGAKTQMTWTSRERGVLGVIGIERDGKVTVLFPPAEIAPGAATPLGDSIVVDESLDGGKICAFFGPSAIALDDAAARACNEGRAASTLELRVRP